MVKKRWYLYLILAIFIVGAILGSFLDFQLSSAIYQHDNGFGLFMSSVGESPVYLFIGILGFASLKLCKDYKLWWQRMLLILFLLATLGVVIYFQGADVISINSYNLPSLKWVGFLVAFIIWCLGFILGYFLLRNSDISPKHLLIIILTLSVICAVSIGITQLLKIIANRPRFRFLAASDNVDNFKNWWQSGTELKKLYVDKYLPSGELITSEEFKSFPSGHVSMTANIIPMFATLPLLNKKIKIKQPILLCITTLYIIVLAYTRIRVGAHFLSDVSIGGIISILAYIGFNELYVHLNRKWNNEEIILLNK